MGSQATGPPKQPLVDVQNVTRTFPHPRLGSIVAVDNASFQCFPGEVFGLLGPNGAGKTTMLRVIATLLTPDRGTVTVNGYDVRTSPDQVRRQIGYLSASTGVYDRLTPREFVSFFGRLHGLGPEELEQRLDELIRLLNLEEYADVVCAKLSSGTRQKVSIARALVHNPPVIIADEPTANLDCIATKHVLDTFEELKRVGKTVILSTHAVYEAERRCDRIAIIHRGRIAACGTPHDIVQAAGAPDLETVFFQILGAPTRADVA